MSGEFQVEGKNKAADFTLKLHRGDGMALVAMNWRAGKPPKDFVGFAIECKPPDADRFHALKNRLSFSGADGEVSAISLSTIVAPIQKFRWVHFPRNADLAGPFAYRVTPVFMNASDELSYGEPQEAEIELRRETYPGQLNVTFTRGFVSSQAFVDRYEKQGKISTLLPAKADDGLDFEPTHPEADEALKWMGFEARDAIFELLDQAYADKSAKVRVVAYDLSEAEFVRKLERLKKRLTIIIDDSGTHGKAKSAETEAAKRLKKSAGAAQVIRQHMKGLQHNKVIVVNGKKVKAAVCGSTNFSWRGFYVQANNAVIVRGKKAIEPFWQAFDDFWDNASKFGATPSAQWTSLGLKDVAAEVAFSPHDKTNALLDIVAGDVQKNTSSSLLFSLAFLYQTPGAIRDAVTKVSHNSKRFVYGISDRKVKGGLGLDLKTPSGNIAPVAPEALTKNVPAPFCKEPTGGGGVRMHHKFVVIDFDKPTARVYLGSYNFSVAADAKNGENLVLIRDRRVAVSYMVEALRLFDHYHFRVAQAAAKKKKSALALIKPPRAAKEKPWWDQYYTDKHRVHDRMLFA